MPALDALDRERTLVVLTASPLEEHGPHLPLGVDAFTARHFAGEVATRLVAARPDWSAVLAPTLYLGSFTLDGVGTVNVRQRVVRDALVDYGRSLARARFRYILVANGHAGPTHLAALDEAATIVSHEYGVTMSSLSGHVFSDFRSGRFLGRVEEVMGRALTAEERAAFADDAHGGWWETSMMLMIRPDLVDDAYRDLPSAAYSLPRRLVPNYPLRNGGQGYVGHPALADPAFARATTDVLVTTAMELVDRLLAGTTHPSKHRSPFFAMPFFRTNFWPLATAGMTAVAAAAVTAATLGRSRRKT